MMINEEKIGKEVYAEAVCSTLTPGKRVRVTGKSSFAGREGMVIAVLREIESSYRFQVRFDEPLSGGIASTYFKRHELVELW